MPSFRSATVRGRWFPAAEHGIVNIGRTESRGAADDDRVTFLFPLQNRAGTDAEFSPDIHGYGDLSLSRELRLRDGHDLYYPGNGSMDSSGCRLAKSEMCRRRRKRPGKNACDTRLSFLNLGRKPVWLQD